MADVADLRLDLTQPGFYLLPDYFDVLAELRERAPVHRTFDGSWAVSRYDDIRSISRDPGRFVSGRGVLINDPLRSDGSGGLPTFSILHLDPPVHSVYRTIVNRQFTPRAVGHLEGTIRRTVTEVLDVVVPDEPVDAVDALASVVPIAVIAELFGVGDADRELFRRWSDAIIASTDHADSTESAQEVGRMAEFLVAHIDSPDTEGNSLLDILKSAELDGRPLNGLEIMGFCMTLLVAGNETTRTLLSGGMEALHQRPDQRSILADDPSLLPVAVEELLRWVTPIQAFGRTAAVDVELSGQEIPAGDFLVMLYASGNRDEEVFGSTAGQLDVRRPVSPTHVAFGFGEHLCLGASLARLEARVFFEELLSRYPTYELVGQPEYVRSTLVRGASRMPIVLAP
ncbi:MAG: cytochrome P450 [Acidimicrobiales bacterium]|jgi:cytochrome P450